MKKKMLSLVLAGAMTAAVLTGCGSSASTTSDAATETAAETTEEAAGTEESADAEASAETSGSTFKIGGIGPLTGGAAVYGNAAMNGSQIAVDEINAAGGINGMTVELNFQDDELDAEKSVNAYNALKDWGAQVLDGCVTSACSIAVSDKTAQDQMFQITPSGSAVECVANDNAFRICFSDPNQGIASAQYIGENGLATKVAVIYDSSDVYSSGIYEKFAAEAQVKGLNVACVEAFTADNKADLTTQVTKCKDAGCDVVFLPFYATEAAQVLTYANTIGYAPTFFGCDGMDGILTVENFDPALAEGLMLLTPFSADASDEATKSFVAKYQEKTGIVPNQFAADAYDVIYSIYQALVAGGATADMSASEINDILVAQFTSMTFDGLTGKGMTWQATGEVSKSPMAVVIKDGTYVGAE